MIPTKRELTAILDAILKEHPPTNEDNIFTAYKKFREQAKINRFVTDDWEDIYKPDTPLDQMTNALWEHLEEDNNDPKRTVKGAGGDTPKKLAKKDTDEGMKQQIAERERYDEERYKLWWEFLRRHKDYRDFCEWTRRKKKDPTCETPGKFKELAANGVIKFIKAYDKCAAIPFDQAGDRKEELEEALKEFARWYKDLFHTKKHGELVKGFFNHGDTYNCSFDEWCRQKQENKIKWDSFYQKPVENLSIELDGLVKLNQAPPDLESLKAAVKILYPLPYRLPQQIVLKIDLCYSSRELSQQINQIIRAEKKKVGKPFSTPLASYPITRRGPQQVVQNSLLRNYLKVFDLHTPDNPSRKTLSEIANQAGSSFRNKETVQRYYREAKKLITRSLLSNDLPF